MNKHDKHPSGIMEPGIQSIFYIKDKSLFHLDTEKLYVSPFDTTENSAEDPVEFKSSSFRCLRIMLQFLYYFLVYPYKMVVDKQEEEVYLVSSTFRKVIWAILQLAFIGISTCSMIANLKFQKKIAEDPTQLYVVAGSFIWFVAILAWPYSVISTKKWVSRLMTTCYRLDNGCNSFLSKNNVYPALTCIVCGVICLLSLTDAVDSVFDLIRTGTFPIGAGETQWELPESSQLRTLVTFIVIPANTIFLLCNWMVFVPGMMACVVIHGISRDYLRYIDTCKDSDKRFVMVLMTYKVVKKLVADINRVSSFYTFLLTVGMMAEFCNHFTFLIGDQTSTSSGDGWNTRAVLVSYFLLLIFCFVLAAEAYNKFQKVDQYILANIGKSYDMDRKVEGVILQNDISQNPLGVRAHHFIISYSVMATILSTVLTYIFILLQFQSAAKPVNPDLKKNAQ